MNYEIINIKPSKVLEESEFKYTVSDWMVCADGITKTAWEYNTKTGEKRPFDYHEAMKAIYS